MPDRREQPLVQAGAVDVALEVAEREGEVRECVGAVHDRADAARARGAADVPHREDLAGQVRDVAEVEDLRGRA